MLFFCIISVCMQLQHNVVKSFKSMEPFGQETVSCRTGEYTCMHTHTGAWVDDCSNRKSFRVIFYLIAGLLDCFVNLVQPVTTPPLPPFHKWGFSVYIEGWLQKDKVVIVNTELNFLQPQHLSSSAQELPFWQADN